MDKPSTLSPERLPHPQVNHTATPDFDCFLSHNSKDKPAVRELAAALRAAGVAVWLDEEQLRPGLPWQPQLEAGIAASRSVAVLVGADGLGPWEDEEQQAALALAVRDHRPVIPVLLPDVPPDVPQAPPLPLFLANRTWVDLRPGAAPGPAAGLDLLIWGITGRKPVAAGGAAAQAAQSPGSGARAGSRTGKSGRPMRGRARSAPRPDAGEERDADAPPTGAQESAARRCRPDTAGPKRRPATLPAQAEQEIKDALDASPALCAALAKALNVETGATPQAIARRLCDPAADFLTVFDAQCQAAAALRDHFRGGPSEAERLRERARRVLGWTTVMTVTEGHEREDCDLVQAWLKGGVFKIPLGRNPCVEVLTARWRGGMAQFGTEPEASRLGEDDITPPAFPEDGINLDDLGETPEVERVWQRVYEKLYGKRPDRKLSVDMKNSLRETVSGWRKHGGPRPRLVIDAADPTNPYASDEVLAAIHEQLPDLYLIRVDSTCGDDPGVFILAPAVLTSRINMTLYALKAIP